jgi:hypothetical protein
MVTNTRTLLCVAIALGSALASSTTHALAGNVYDSPDWAPPLYGLGVQRHPAVGSVEGRAHRPSAPAREGLNATRQPDGTQRSY